MLINNSNNKDYYFRQINNKVTKKVAPPEANHITVVHKDNNKKPVLIEEYINYAS